ncbi:hypothetical protein BCR44DRAFT_1435992 [Catenaria anguillulae PL171]|uniref:Uncharacterized protein n=1 Tax=Catenaria anguillulae PL171 TaxID=765915 RepID=A0A1Y2HN72_9FUNG|nr:hypothetical protein BCR44DRAFT_1435992 [Catenaria anguillulae PL171]
MFYLSTIRRSRERSCHSTHPGDGRYHHAFKSTRYSAVSHPSTLSWLGGARLRPQYPVYSRSHSRPTLL